MLPRFDQRLQLRPTNMWFRQPRRQLAARLEVPSGVPGLIVVLALHGPDIRRLIDNHERVARQMVEKGCSEEERRVEPVRVEALTGPELCDICFDPLTCVALHRRDVQTL